MTPEQLVLDLPDLGTSDPNNMPEVLVYVIHWNAPEWCVRTVRSFRASQHLRTRLTIIDNGGLSEDALAKLQGTEIISTGANIGYTGGANRAFEAWRTTSSPVAVIACHDVELHEEALSLLVQAVACVRRSSRTVRRAPVGAAYFPLVVTVAEAVRPGVPSALLISI